LESRLAALDALIGKPEFDEVIDTLISDIDAAGMMEKFEPELLRLDRENSNAIVKASGII
jgi:hypothetical protein